MAKSMTPAGGARKKVDNSKKVVIEDINMNEEEEVVVVDSAPTVKEKKVFKNDELIPCRSITNGELLMTGNKTNNLYKWADYDDVTEVEYQDLIYDVRVSGSSFAKHPCFIVLDDDFVEQNKQLADLYESRYSIKDLKGLLKMADSDIARIVPELPAGAKNSLKGIASTMIQNGQLDSMRKIKLLDELLETEMLHTLLEN